MWKDGWMHAYLKFKNKFQFIFIVKEVSPKGFLCSYKNKLCN